MTVAGALGGGAFGTMAAATTLSANVKTHAAFIAVSAAVVGTVTGTAASAVVTYGIWRAIEACVQCVRHRSWRELVQQGDVELAAPGQAVPLLPLSSVSCQVARAA